MYTCITCVHMHHVCTNQTCVHTGTPHTRLQHINSTMQHTCTHYTQTIGTYDTPCITYMYTCHTSQIRVCMLHHTYHTRMPAMHSTTHIFMHITLICTYRPHTILMHMCHMHSTHLYTCTVDTDAALLGGSPWILRLADIGWCDM